MWLVVGDWYVCHSGIAAPANDHEYATGFTFNMVVLPEVAWCGNLTKPKKKHPHNHPCHLAIFRQDALEKNIIRLLSCL
jgi:hypothetical protein